MCCVAAVLPTVFQAQAHHHYKPHDPGCKNRKCDRRVDKRFAQTHPRKAYAAWAKHHVQRNAGGWVIPTAVVMCESKGTNERPNSASAAGYYQITAGTWEEGGGSPPNDASQHSKAEQDVVAARLWDHGRGASRWVCKG